jgi:hypothetical protein
VVGNRSAGIDPQKNLAARWSPRYPLDLKLPSRLGSTFPGGVAANVLGDVANP